MAKCKLFDYCTLRIFYEGAGKHDDWLKKYCNSSKFKECGRYKLETIEERKVHRKPSEVKKRRKRK